MNKLIVNSLIKQMTNSNSLLRKELASYQSPAQNAAVFNGSEFFKLVASTIKDQNNLKNEIAETSMPTLLEKAKLEEARKQIEETNRIIEAIAKEKRPDTKNHNAFQKSFK